MDRTAGASQRLHAAAFAILGVVNFVFMAACASDEGSGIPDAPLDLEAVSGAGQAAPKGEALADPFIVKVTDDAGGGVGGVRVRFMVTAGAGILSGGNVEPGSSIERETDASGVASVMLTLGPSAGEHVVTVDLPDRPLTPPVTFMATAGPKSPDISVNLLEPTKDRLVANEMSIRISVQSTFTVDNAIAAIGDIETPLVFSGSSTGAMQFQGRMALATVPQDSVLLVVTVTDVNGSVTAAFRRVVHDEPPQVSVSAPLNFSVGRPGLAFDVTCSDGPHECTQIIVTHGGVEIASGATSITGTFPLIDHATQLLIRATDVYGQAKRRPRLRRRAGALCRRQHRAPDCSPPSRG